MTISNFFCETHKSDHVIITGDFNCPDIDWIELTSPPSYDQSDFLLETLELDLTQRCLSPTRGEKVLDLVFENSPLIDDLYVGQPITFSDHLPVVFEVSSPQFPNVSINSKSYNFKLMEIGPMALYLELQDWFQVLGVHENPSISSMYSRFAKFIESFIDTFIPLRVSRNVKVKYPKFIRKLLHKYRALLRKSKTRPNDTDLTQSVKRAKDSYDFAIRRFTKEREERILFNGNSNSFFKFVRHKLNRRSKIVDMRDSTTNQLVTDCFLIAEGFRNQYDSVFIEDDGILPNLNQTTYNGPASNFMITQNLICQQINKIRSSSSPGPDNFHPIILKRFARQLSVPLKILFLKSLEQSELPKDWKIANVVPVYKGKGSRHEYVNYRPVSLTSHVSKLMERIMTKWLLDELINRNFISPHQHGFLASRSVTTNLLTCLFDWVGALDNHESVDVIYLDIAKAFDTVSHPKLMHKLDSLNLPPKLTAWIKDFLTNRCQRVKIEQSFSNESPVTSGVPQGTVLGPILFLIYINDICEAVSHCKIKIFADDTKIYLNYSENQTDLQNDLDGVSVWLDTWQLKVSVNKCSVLPLSRSGRRECCDYSLNGSIIPKSVNVRDLGIQMSSDLKFKTHVQRITANASARSGLIFKCFKTRDKAFLTSMFSVFVRPLLEFATPIWSPYQIGLITCVEKVQRNFTKRIPAVRDLNYPDRLTALNMEPLELRRLRFDLIELFKIVKGFSVIKFDDYFKLKQLTLRQNNDIQIQLHVTNSNLSKNFFNFRAAKIWNALPQNIIDSSSVDIFKRRLLKFDLSNKLVCFPDHYLTE